MLSTLQKKLVNDLKDYVKARSIPPERSEERYSARAQRIHKIISERSFGCKSQDVVDLVSAILGEPIKPIKDENNRIEGYVAIVPLAEYSGHDYEIGKVVLTYPGSDRCWKRLGLEYGNSLNMGGSIFEHLEQKKVRYATPEEIDSFFAEALAAWEESGFPNNSAMNAIRDAWLKGQFELNKAEAEK